RDGPHLVSQVVRAEIDRGRADRDAVSRAQPIRERLEHGGAPGEEQEVAPACGKLFGERGAKPDGGPGDEREGAVFVAERGAHDASRSLGVEKGRSARAMRVMSAIGNKSHGAFANRTIPRRGVA